MQLSIILYSQVDSHIFVFLLVGILPEKVEESVAATNLNTRFRLVEGDDPNECFGNDTIHGLDDAFVINKVTI